MSVQPGHKWLRMSLLKCVIPLQSGDVGRAVKAGLEICRTASPCAHYPSGSMSVISHFSRCHESGVEVEPEPQVGRWGFVVVVQNGFEKQFR